MALCDRMIPTHDDAVQRHTLSDGAARPVRGRAPAKPSRAGCIAVLDAAALP